MADEIHVGIHVLGCMQKVSVADKPSAALENLSWLIWKHGLVEVGRCGKEGSVWWQTMIRKGDDVMVAEAWCHVS